MEISKAHFRTMVQKGPFFTFFVNFHWAILSIRRGNTALGTKFAFNFCVGIVQLQLGIVRVLFFCKLRRQNQSIIDKLFRNTLFNRLQNNSIDTFIWDDYLDN